MDEQVKHYLRVKQFANYVAMCRIYADLALVDGAIIASALRFEGYHHTYKWLHRFASRTNNVYIAYRYY